MFKSKKISADKLSYTQCVTTSDGEKFEAYNEALRHQKLLDAIEYFNDNPLYGDVIGCTVRGKELVDFILDHQGVVKNIVNDEED